MRKLLEKLIQWLWRSNIMKSKWYSKIKIWYEKELWTLDMVFAAVPKMITADEYKQITGLEYEFEEEQVTE